MDIRCTAPRALEGNLHLRVYSSQWHAQPFACVVSYLSLTVAACLLFALPPSPARAAEYWYTTQGPAAAACTSALASLSTTQPVYSPCVFSDFGGNAGDYNLTWGPWTNGYHFEPPLNAAPGNPGKTAGPPCSCAGDPINLGTGNEYRKDLDASSGNLSFHRYYNSQPDFVAANLGAHWRHSFDRSLSAPGATPTQAFLSRPDGRQFAFNLQSGAWVTDPDVADTLTSTTDGSGNITGWTYFEAATRDHETYNASGQLTAILDANQQTTTLAYSTASTPTTIAPAAGLLITVTDPHGRQLSLIYDSSSRVSTITLPDGGVLGYQYDSATGNLIKVTYPDASFKQYVYNESALTNSTALPNALTGEIDETQTRYGDIGYDTQGRAIMSRHAGGADLTQVAYNSNGTTTVTYPNGAQTTLGFVVPNGSVHANSANVPCGPGCGQPNQSATYDSNGYPASYTDFNDNLTKTTYDTNGLLDQQVDASGTTNQRTTTTTWNTTLRVPLTRTVQDNNSNLVASTTWAYNSAGQALAQCKIDPNISAAASYSCAATGSVPAGVRRWTNTYCTAVDTTQCPLVGLLLTTTGPRTDLTQTTSYAYYLDDTNSHQHGDLKSVTDALAHTTTFLSYDDAGRVLSQQDANGVTTTYTYHPRGWLHTRTVGGATTTITYTPYGAVQTVTDPDNITVTYGYDAAHRLTDITDAQGNHIHYTLDASGNRTAENTYASGSTTPSRSLTRNFNILGQLTKVIDGLNHTVFDASATGNYDGDGNLVQSKDALNIARKQGYDALNRLSQTIDNYNGTDTATKNTTSGFAYDALDRLTGVIDPSSLTTTYGYDGLGNRISLQSPDTGSSNDTYDAAGNRLTHTDAKSIVSTTSYDALNRPIGTSYSDSAQTNDNVTYAYDEANSVTGCSASYPIGRLTRVIESAVTTVYCYDARGNTTRKQQITGANTDTTSYSYTSADRLNTLTEPSGSLIAYGHDSVGRVNSVTVTPTGGSATTAVSSVSYLPFGPVSGYTLGNGQAITRTYDANYALSDLTSPALNLHFARDLMGNINAEGNTPGASPATESYGYDPLYRLTSVTDGTTPLQGFTYNPTGDRTSKTGSGLATGTYGYQANTHWLTSIGSAARSYDNNGNTTGNSSAGQTWGYGYNGRNRMTVVQAGGATVGTYTYNAMGQRIQKVATLPSAITQRFAYDEQSHLIGEYTSISNRDTVWLDDLPIATVDTADGTSAVNYITVDHLGTPRAVSDSTGTTIWSWPYMGNAFGELLPTSTIGYTLNLRFPGQYVDAESGLFYNNNRFLCPECGRYIQSDPIGLEGGPSAYSYVNSSPMSFSDPYGTQITIPWVGPLVGGEVGAGDIVGQPIDLMPIMWSRSHSDPVRDVKPTNPGRDCDRNCKPCPPGWSWAVPGNDHGSTSGWHWHWIEYNQDSKTCMCYPFRRSGAEKPNVPVHPFSPLQSPPIA